jgi:hypothetical protein
MWPFGGSKLLFLAKFHREDEYDRADPNNKKYADKDQIEE